MALGLSLAKECFSVDDVSLTFKPSVHRFIIVRSRRILERKEMICGWNIRDGRCFLISSPQLLDVQGRKARQWAICFFFLRHIFQNFCGSKMLRNVCYHKVVICSLRNASSFPITFCFESRSAIFHFFFYFISRIFFYSGSEQWHWKYEARGSEEANWGTFYIKTRPLSPHKASEWRRFFKKLILSHKLDGLVYLKRFLQLYHIRLVENPH